MAANILPAQSALREYFDYIPETGALTWRKPPNQRLLAGRQAGRLDDGGYYRIGLGGTEYRAHRIIYKLMTGTEPPELVDHINGDPMDNRWANLRPATMSLNQMNRLNKHGKGIQPKGRKFVATLRLGTFATLKEAQTAYLRAFRLVHGDLIVRGI